MERKFPFSGIILDVDGVITDTRRTHYEAWKKIFDTELRSRDQPEFSESDYQKFVDGRPREEGISTFFTSRRITLTDAEIRSLAEEKNNVFLDILKSRPPQLYNDFLEAFKEWEAQNISVMAVSSSKNCRSILESVGVKQNFKCIIDGTDAQALHLKGKPSPEYFLEAARKIHLSPDDCAIVEDAIPGVKAGRNGNFSYVIGMGRFGQTSPVELYQNGADFVVPSLREVGKLKNILSSLQDFKARVGSREISLFIDYDGTLTNIVNDPKEALLSDSMRSLLSTCSKSFKVSVISGRDLLDVKQKVGISSIFYSGCHGLDISGPGCFHFQVEEVSAILPQLEEASLMLSTTFSNVKGILIERKQFSTALHYRMVTEISDEKVSQVVLKLISHFKNLKIKHGKKVIEILPDVQWDKSQAVDKISQILEIDPEATVPVYIGDDITDEDVFLKYRRKGICIKVCDDEYLHNAHYKLKGPLEVEKFLSFLAQEYAGEEKRWKPGL